MKKIIEYLKHLDFSTTEITLYLILLKHGELSVAELAEIAKINRTATYKYINSLLTKGVAYTCKGVSSKIAANPPEQLEYLVEQKLGRARILYDSLPSIVSYLNTSFAQKKEQSTSEIKYFKGRSGVKSIYREALKANKLRTYFNCAELVKVFPENCELFNNAFKHNTKIVMYELLEDSSTARRQVQGYPKDERYQFKFLPDDITLLANDILIYDEKVAIINVKDLNNISGVILNNVDYYNNSKQLFDLLWRLLPTPSQV